MLAGSAEPPITFGVNRDEKRLNFLGIRPEIRGRSKNLFSVWSKLKRADKNVSEIYDLVGIVAEGHPNPKRLLMTEEWPEGVFPLLKKWDVKSLRKAVDGEEWT